MPNTLTMFSRDLAIRSLLTPADVTPLTDLEVALTKTIAPNNADITQIVEPTADLYTRQPYFLGALYWAPTGFGALYNTVGVVWPMVLEEFWGYIAGWALIDPTSNSVINTGSLLAPYEAITGMTPKLPPGSMICGIYD